MTTPLVPGFVVSSDAQPGKTKQTLNYMAGGPMVGTVLTLPEISKLDLETIQQEMADPSHRYTHRSSGRGSAPAESARATGRQELQRPPVWLKHDRQVLRFFAYFEELCHAYPKEPMRTRLCTILFYLEDGTMMVSEPKNENSGMPQGCMVKRHKIPNGHGGGIYGPEDLSCGWTIVVYSRHFHIYDCDDFTRAWYKEEMGRDMPRDEPPTKSSLHAPQVFSSLQKTRQLQESREYYDLLMGGSRKNTKLRQYLENDGKVLAFKCYWDDPTRYGSRMYFTLHYYLADDSVELLEVLPKNSGRHPYPTFWRRSPLVKNPHMSCAPAMYAPEPVICKPEDFRVGEAVQVHGRSIFLYDCDEFTRDFYHRYQDFEQGKVEIDEPQPVQVNQSYPPHTGIGTEDDSLASCKHLTPRVPRKDVNKLLLDAGKVLRFEAALVGADRDNANRRFVVCAYIADDHVAVLEIRQRNSGHVEGKFATKSRKHNPATGTWFRCSDFFVGATVEINGARFILTAAEEWTLNYMEKHCDEFPLEVPPS